MWSRYRLKIGKCPECDGCMLCQEDNEDLDLNDYDDSDAYADDCIAEDY